MEASKFIDSGLLISMGVIMLTGLVSWFILKDKSSSGYYYKDKCTSTCFDLR